MFEYIHIHISIYKTHTYMYIHSHTHTHISVVCQPPKNAEIALLVEEYGPIWDLGTENRFELIVGKRFGNTNIVSSSQIPDKSAISAISAAHMNPYTHTGLCGSTGRMAHRSLSPFSAGQAWRRLLSACLLPPHGRFGSPKSAPSCHPAGSSKLDSHQKVLR